MKQDSPLHILAYKLMLAIPDKWFLSMKYYKNFGRFPDWKNPRTFNEKLQWLKINNRRPEYPLMVDKYEAKAYVAQRIGQKYVIPTLGVWDKAEDIDFDSLPDKFILKATHDSGRVVVCKDKSKLDKAEAREEMRKSLKRDFYAVTREWPYKNVKRRIIAEELLEDGTGEDIKDYKLFCFGGHVKFCKVDFDRFTDHHANYYDREWSLLPFGEVDYPVVPARQIERPKTFDEMISLAERLAAGMPFVRVDFYDVNDQIYFGEITLFPASGTRHFEPEEWDTILGSWLEI